MDKVIKNFLDYKLFTEQLVTKKHKYNFLNMLCEIAELEFLARLPRVASKEQTISYINKMNLKYDANYDAQYLYRRWTKIFKDNLYTSLDKGVHFILKRDRNICQYCNRNSNLEIHHVIPKDEKKYRGVNSYYNLVLACKKCNIEISNSIRLPENWWTLHPDSRHCPLE